jgi:hypothetical protein
VRAPSLRGFKVAVNTRDPVPPGGNVAVVHDGILRFTNVIGGHNAPKFQVEVTHSDGADIVKGHVASSTPPKCISGGSKAITDTSFAEAGPEFV